MTSLFSDSSDETSTITTTETYISTGISHNIEGYDSSYSAYFYQAVGGSLSIPITLSMSSNRIYELVKEKGSETFSGITSNELMECKLVVDDNEIPRSDTPICHVCNITTISDISCKTFYIYLPSQTLPDYVYRF